jgi:hypothetical protein
MQFQHEELCPARSPHMGHAVDGPTSSGSRMSEGFSLSTELYSDRGLHIGPSLRMNAGRAISPAR